jgi:heterodisulfide reductase subunit A-like polyferredoxin
MDPLRASNHNKSAAIAAPGSPVGAVMVVGGGITGMQASLDMANAGFLVYLVEKDISIGGVMAKLDKTFPTNDCSTCIISPKLIDVATHPNIKILTRSTIAAITGQPGNFQVVLNREPRYIDEERCTGCGECLMACPVELNADFNLGLNLRKAIYRHFPQAIPSAFAIDKFDRAPCVISCPAGINVQGYVQLINQGKYEEAVQLIMERLPLPGVLGRVCPHPCEFQCRRGEVDVAVAIRDLKRFAADQVDLDDLPLPEIEERPEKVAVVGSGPAGLTVAYDLRLKGYQVTIFEALSVLGGMLRVGIPDYRLPPDVLDREINYILRLGIETQTGKRLGTEFTLESLTQQGFKAIFLGLGAHGSLKLHIPGEDEFTGVVDAVDFLREVNLGSRKRPGERLVIIGGGNVAIDAARTALRLGCQEVTVVYRRSREEMPAYPEEIEGALAEGVKMHYLTAPVRILGADGRVCGFECLRTELGPADESGRRRPVPVEGSEFVIECDAVIPAIGQQPEVEWLSNDPGLEISRRNTLVVNRHTMQTNTAQVFAAGDAVSGPATVIEAVAAAHRAAEAIHRYIQGEDLEQYAAEVASRPEPGQNWLPIPEGLEATQRFRMPRRDPAERLRTFSEVELGFSEAEAHEEALRCLNCGGCSECMACVHACAANAIDHRQQAEMVSLDVGALIVCAGFEPFDARLKAEYGYGRYANVITSLEFERILSAAGPFAGHIERLSDGKPPTRLAWIQCVGSRDASVGQDYCSSVCCMYATKQAIIAREHDRAIEPTVFFIDMRAMGKGFERYFEQARSQHGVRYVRSMISRVVEDPLTRNLEISYFDEAGDLHEETLDLVILSVGLKPSAATQELARTLDVPVDRFGFVESDPFNAVATMRPGIFCSGVIQDPKDIPDSVSQASAAAAEAMGLLAPARNQLVEEISLPPERSVTGDIPRIGVFVCHCGINIAGVVDVEEVTEYARDLPNVVYADHLLFSCATDSTERIKEVVQEQNLNRVVVASCSPRTHEPLFQDTIREAGLNKYLFEMANIRDQCSWVHAGEPATATDKAKDLVRMAVARATFLEPLQETEVPIVQRALVVGAGAAGMTAALNLAEQGFEAVLVEKADNLGGRARTSVHYTPTGTPVQPFVDALVKQVESHDRIRVLTNATVVNVSGSMGNFKSLVRVDGGEEEVEYGVAIIATGGSEYEPTEYLYSQDQRVLTQTEFHQMLAQEDPSLQQVSRLVMIQCVGSRDEERPYCSRVCCTAAVSNALRLKTINPEAQVFILYRDIRTFGRKELLYKEAREAGIRFIRFAAEQKPLVRNDHGVLEIEVQDQNLGRSVRLPSDLLVLSAGVVPNPASRELAEVFKLSSDADGFFMEAHVKLRPLDFANAGIFLCGLAHSPKFLDECLAQARGAAARAAEILSQEKMMCGGRVAVVDPGKCAACCTCVRTCPYEVPYIGRRGVAVIEAAACHGCGACVAECPGKAISLQHLTDQQVFGKCDALEPEVASREPTSRASLVGEDDTLRHAGEA